MEKQELKRLSISIWDQLHRAVQAGDKSKATELIEEIQENVKKIKGVMTDCIDLALTSLAEQCGEEVVSDVMEKFSGNSIWPVFGEDFARLSGDERLRRRAYGWTALHGVNITIGEDEEKFILKIPCSTGGLLVAKKERGKVKETHPRFCGERDISLYCTHCLVAFEVMALNRQGHPWWINFPPKRAGELCVQYHYKDITKTPEIYYRRAGKDKPIDKK